MKLIAELVESVTPIEESVGGKKYMYLEGVFLQSEIKNRNGRIYPRGVMESALNKYNTDKVENKTAYGELGHPAGPTINPERISHIIESLRWDGNNVIGRAKILETDYGTIAQKIIEGGGRLGVSSRGMGTLRERNGIDEVQSDYYIATAADIVTDPSAPQAFVNGIMESVDWIYRAGAWVPQYVEEAQKEINSAYSTKDKVVREQKLLKVWENYLKSM